MGFLGSIGQEPIVLVLVVLFCHRCKGVPVEGRMKYAPSNTWICSDDQLVEGFQARYTAGSFGGSVDELRSTKLEKVFFNR